MYYSGLTVTSWVKVERDANIEYEVLGDEVELYLGGRRGNFQLNATEDGLNELVTKGSEALRELRAGDVDE